MNAMETSAPFRGMVASDIFRTIDKHLKGEGTYEPEEFPEYASTVFLEAYDDACRRGDHDTRDSIAIAAALILTDTDLKADSFWKIYHSIDMVGYFSESLKSVNMSKTTASKLAAWLRDETLLSTDRWCGIFEAVELHRASLFSLAFLQEDGSYEDIWRSWFRPTDLLPYKHKHSHTFIPAAFIGLALSNPYIAAGDLYNLLEYAREAGAKGIEFPLRYALRALQQGLKNSRLLVVDFDNI